MIIVAFLLPLSLYFLALSWVNRQPRPVVVAGTWDFVGLLFAASGFLLVGGPAVLSSFNDRWRRIWLLGESSSLPDSLDGYREFWMLLAVTYFLVVVVGSGVVLARRRRLTCIYNVEPVDVESALGEACKQLGIAPIRSGNLFLFGFSNVMGVSFDLATPTEQSKTDVLGIKEVTPSHGGHLHQRVPQPRPEEPNAILEVDSSNALKHVTLLWEPHDSPLRTPVEAELRHRLARVPAPEHDAAVWCNLLGTALLMVSMFVLVLLIARNYFMR